MPAQIAELRARWGLDRPVWEQLALFLWRMLTLDLGHSYIYNQPVGLLILERLPATLLLMSSGICFAFSLGLTLGIAAARRAGSWADTALVAFALIAYAMPGFWLGLMMIVIFSVKLAWLPLGGLGTLGAELTGTARVLDVARHLVMPTIAVSLIYLAIYLRLMRAGMLEIYGLDFVRTARAKGLTEGRIAWRHVARNALLPMVTMLGLQFSALFGGSVVVESVFSLPGIGRLAYEFGGGARPQHAARHHLREHHRGDPGQSGGRPHLCAARSAHRVMTRRSGGEFFGNRGGAVGIAIMLAGARGCGARAMALSRRPARCGGAAAAAAVRGCPLPARHRPQRPRHRGRHRARGARVARRSA